MLTPTVVEMMWSVSRLLPALAREFPVPILAWIYLIDLGAEVNLFFHSALKQMYL